MKIMTNNHARPFLSVFDVPANVLESDFDHLSTEDTDTDHFVHYKGRYYHISDFVRTEPMDQDNRTFPAPWEGYAPDSAFSGVLISIMPDGETYKIATYTC